MRSLAALVLALAAAPLAAQQSDTTRTRQARADSARADSARAQQLAPTVITGTRLSDVDERTPLQVDQIHVGTVPPGPAAAASAIASLPGVSLFDDQGTPVQPTLEIRGFTLSPVVGVPQGVSVFLDGVRINEPDAQQVNFDLIPMDAVARAELVRGPATLFGKNTLAGALVLFTRRGDSTPHFGGQLEAGSFGYRGATLSASGVRGGFDAYVMGHYSTEDGWRVDTPARQRQLFLNLGRKRDSSDLALTVFYAHDRLKQAGSLPESWLPIERNANYTTGDYFDPRLVQLALRGERRLGGGTIRGNVFGRFNDMEQFNVNIDAPSTDAFVRNHSGGTTVEWSTPVSVGARTLGLTVGGEYARNDVRYRVFQQAAPNGPIEADCDQATGLCENAHVPEDDAALYAQGVLDVGPHFSVTGALRADWVRVPFEDLTNAENSATNTFRRLSPRLGVNWEASHELRGYAAVSTGFRAPAALELACADENAPCPLPFSLGDDPPLRPVSVTNYETGVDWEPAGGIAVDVVGYRTDVRNEIVFVASQRTAGFFQNIPRTRRQGIEASVSVPFGNGFRAFGSYGFVDATYESTVALASQLGDNVAHPGDRFPLSPAHRGTIGLDATRVFGTTVLTGQIAVRAVSSQYVRGNDANFRTVDLDGRTVSGLVDGYSSTTLRLGVERGLLGVSLDVSNLFDQRYQTFGIFAENPLGLPGGPRPAEAPLERFLNPGYPRALTLSVSVKR